MSAPESAPHVGSPRQRPPSARPHRLPTSARPRRRRTSAPRLGALRRRAASSSLLAARHSLPVRLGWNRHQPVAVATLQPPAALMDHWMVYMAHQPEVTPAGATTVDPIVEVVHIAPFGGTVASRKLAMFVRQHHPTPQRRRRIAHRPPKATRPARFLREHPRHLTLH